MLAIYKKELHAYFSSVIGWLFIAFFLAFVGLYFYSYNLQSGLAFIGYALFNVTLIFALLVPMVTMRIMAEENRQKTDQLLLTSPVPIWKIVAGKYLTLVTITGIPMLVICLYPLILAQFGIVNFKMSYVAIFGFFMIACAYMAIGLFISTLTESQAFAAVMTFIVVLLTCLSNDIANKIPATPKAAWLTYSVLWALVAVWIWRMIKNATAAIIIFSLGECVLTGIYLLKPEWIDGTVYEVFSTVSMLTVYNRTCAGVLDVQMPVYYLSIAFVFCFLTLQTIRKRRYN